MQLPDDLTTQEELALVTVLQMFRGGWDRIEADIKDDLRDAVVRGQQFPAGTRLMGRTFTLRAFCDHVRDPLHNEVL